jgi:hypothetical protein
LVALFDEGVSAFRAEITEELESEEEEEWSPDIVELDGRRGEKKRREDEKKERCVCVCDSREEGREGREGRRGREWGRGGVRRGGEAPKNAENGRHLPTTPLQTDHRHPRRTSRTNWSAMAASSPTS